MVPVLLLALLSGAPASRAPREQAEEPVCVVAHLPDGVDPTSVNAEIVRRLFLVRQRFWPDGAQAHPVNLPASSPVRERFSRAAFGQGVKDMAPYWNDRYFHGTRPPPTVASEAAVILFLERTPGGVGYVQAPRADSLPSSVTRLFCLAGDTPSTPAIPRPEAPLREAR
ncbi:MAG TPA: hypothetical protein VJ997_06015 [Longimicrobiales bacterium]|nr:hypothetical protein [Longimicrobiales bacterium]